MIFQTSNGQSSRVNVSRWHILNVKAFFMVNIDDLSTLPYTTHSDTTFANSSNPPPITPNDLQVYVRDSAINLRAALPQISLSPTPEPPLSSISAPRSASGSFRSKKWTTKGDTGLRRTSRVHKPRHIDGQAEEGDIARSCGQRRARTRRTSASTRQTLTPPLSATTYAAFDCDLSSLSDLDTLRPLTPEPDEKE